MVRYKIRLTLHKWKLQLEEEQMKFINVLEQLFIQFDGMPYSEELADPNMHHQQFVEK